VRHLEALEQEIHDLIAGDPPPPVFMRSFLLLAPLRRGGSYLKLLL
jgi:hypothetical protein